MLPNLNRKTPNPTDKRRPSGKKGLDRQQVLKVARALCADGGVARLSIKELAQRLGIQPPSVYAHFAGLADIRRALALWGHGALTERLAQAVEGRHGTDAVLALGHAYLEFIRREPGLYSATVATPAADDVELRAASEHWMRIMRAALGDLGLAHDDIGHAVRGIRSIVHGFGQLESSGAFRAPLDRDASFSQVLRIFVKAVGEQGAAARARSSPS